MPQRSSACSDPNFGGDANEVKIYIDIADIRIYPDMIPCNRAVGGGGLGASSIAADRRVRVSALSVIMGRL